MTALTEVIKIGDRESALSVRRAELLYAVAGSEPKRVTSSAARLTVGSGPGNDLVLEDPTVSRIHAELVRTEDGYRIKDLGSTNGTYVSSVRITDAYLGEQATLTFGKAAVRFQVVHDRDDLPLHPQAHFGRLVGQGVAMRALFAELARLSATQATVLIEGESGTGKELVAEALHQNGMRAAKPFIIVDCGAIPSELVESELFGHEKGAFTGASSDRRGAFEAADGGTLFLDEIGELPLSVQPKLLRALERRQIKRVGADVHRTVELRFLAATHRDLRAMVNRGQFREDLYFRLAVATVRVPPLREHLEDLPLLLEHLWSESARSLGVDKAYAAPSAETLRTLSTLPWEGNVRELRNFVERSLALSGALDGQRVKRVEAPSQTAAIRYDLPFKEAKDAWVDQFEKAYLAQRLEQAGGNVSQLSREAEMDRAHLIKLLKKHAVK